MKVQAEWKVQIKNTSFLLFVNEIVNCTKFVVLGMQSFQLRLKFLKTKLISYQRQILPNNNYQWYCPHIVSVSVKKPTLIVQFMHEALFVWLAFVLRSRRKLIAPAIAIWELTLDIFTNKILVNKWHHWLTERQWRKITIQIFGQRLVKLSIYIVKLWWFIKSICRTRLLKA